MLLKRRLFRFSVLLRPAAVRNSCSFSAEFRPAGASPRRSPMTRLTASANANDLPFSVTESSSGVFAGDRVFSNGITASDAAAPSAPATQEYAIPSVRSCRRRRVPAAPSALRIANSRSLCAARARNKLRHCCRRSATEAPLLPTGSTSAFGCFRRNARATEPRARCPDVSAAKLLATHSQWNPLPLELLRGTRRTSGAP